MVLSDFPTVTESIDHLAVKLSPVTSNANEEIENIKTIELEKKYGVEINQIGMLRSGLPILGRNQRYKLIDVTLTGSITDSNFFLDIDAWSDFGAGIDDIDIKLPNGKIKIQ